MPTRKAEATWEGSLQQGKGSFKGESGAISGSYSFGTRFGDTPGTNPEELLAAAEAACFSMALSLGLANAGLTPERVHTEAACTIEKSDAGFTITTMKLQTRVRVQGGGDEAQIRDIVQQTKQGCPVSRALAGVKIEVEPTIER